jgi:hypothetical protein
VASSIHGRPYLIDEARWEGTDFEVTIEPREFGASVSSEIEHTFVHSDARG